MLNERQDELKLDMIFMCEGVSNKKTKFQVHQLCDDVSMFDADSRNRFHASSECRQMSDDFDAITFDPDNDYIVVSDKSGVFITKSVTARSIYADNLHIKALKIIIKEYKVRGLPLPNQIVLPLEVE